jgi:hypothetical protein
VRPLVRPQEKGYAAGTLALPVTDGEDRVSVMGIWRQAWGKQEQANPVLVARRDPDPPPIFVTDFPRRRDLGKRGAASAGFDRHPNRSVRRTPEGACSLFRHDSDATCTTGAKRWIRSEEGVSWTTAAAGGPYRGQY